MANIHQTMKRVEALYADLLGTREEITRCVEELQRWQREQEQVSQEALRSLIRLRDEVTHDVGLLGQQVRQQKRDLEQLAAAERNWAWMILWVGIFGAVLAILLEKAFKWLLAQF